MELQPVGTNQATVVWEWHAWDHLVQEADPAKANYAPVAQHPELLHVNYAATANQPDWLHLNSIDYNPALDQILLSSHGLNEVWVIDHSTTTAQAAGHSGGRSGKGGDLLYRWGNPAAYGQGTSASNSFWPAQCLLAGRGRALRGQHPGVQQRPGPAGRQLVVGRRDYAARERPASTAPLPYGPSCPGRDLRRRQPTNFFAKNISGAQRLPNGNLLVCNGPAGRCSKYRLAPKSGTTSTRWAGAGQWPRAAHPPRTSCSGRPSTPAATRPSPAAPSLPGARWS